MKKICFLISLILCFSFVSCKKEICLYNAVIKLTMDGSVHAGYVMCYGRKHDNSISEDTLSEYLGLSGYPAFKERIEELAVYSAIGEEFEELAVLKLYSCSDIADGVLFFERRIKAAKRAKMFDFDTSAADNAYISVYGNTVVLFMLKDNEAMQKRLEKYI